MNLFDSRCRTDFMLAPTRTSVVDLEIITPPAKPIIYDEDDNSIIRTKLGPYRLGKRHWVWNNTKFRIGRKEWGGRTNERILGRGRSWRCSTSRSYESLFIIFITNFYKGKTTTLTCGARWLAATPPPLSPGGGNTPSSTPARPSTSTRLSATSPSIRSPGNPKKASFYQLPDKESTYIDRWVDIKIDWLID